MLSFLMQFLSVVNSREQKYRYFNNLNASIKYSLKVTSLDCLLNLYNPRGPMVIEVQTGL